MGKATVALLRIADFCLEKLLQLLDPQGALYIPICYPKFMDESAAEEILLWKGTETVNIFLDIRGL